MPGSKECSATRRRGRPDRRARPREALARLRRHLRERGHRRSTGRRRAAKASRYLRTDELEATARPIGPTHVRDRRRRRRPRPLRLPARRLRAASAAGSPRRVRDRGGRRRAPGHRRGGRRDPRRRRQRRRRRGRGVARVVRRGDRDDGPARRRPRDLPRRGDRAASRNLDCFVAVPSGDGAPMDAAPGAVRRGARALRDRRLVVRGARAARRGSTSCGARTGACRGRGSSSRRCGSRASGVAMPAAHAACLAMLAPVMTMREGARIYAPDGQAPRRRRPARPAGSRRRARADPRRGRGVRLLGHDRARRCSSSSRERDGAITARRSRRRTAPSGPSPSRSRSPARRVLTRGGLSGVAETLDRFDPAGGPAALLAALDGDGRGGGHTTNLTRRRRATATPAC